MMGLGGILVVAGLVGTTASTNGGNQSCPSGTVLIAKFEYVLHGYLFEQPFGNEHVVTLSNESASGANWHSTLPVSYVIVKGGPDVGVVHDCAAADQRIVLERRPPEGRERQEHAGRLERAVLWPEQPRHDHDRVEHDNVVHDQLDFDDYDRTVRDDHDDASVADHDV